MNSSSATESGSAQCIILPLSFFFLLTFLTFTVIERVQIIWAACNLTFVEDTNSDFMLQHCYWSSCYLSCSVWPVAMMALWEQLPGSTPCCCATAPGSPVPLERYYFQTYWQTCCSCWWSMAGLPLHRYRCLVRNALENDNNNLVFFFCLFCHRIVHFKPFMMLFVFIGRLVCYCSDFGWLDVWV